jgi:glycosyltransferase involved in cell wall biosynthesis
VSEVSVIVPARDGERYLAEALESILVQTLAPAEVIVVDDGSTDGTAGVAARFAPRVRCVRQEAGGAAAAVNRGIGEADGPLIAFLDADDLWTPDKLALQVAAMEGDPELDLVFGHVEQFHSPELEEADRRAIVASNEHLVGYSRGTMLARREALDRVGPFDTRWQVGEFVDWHARAVDSGLRMLVVPEVVMRRRMHTSNAGLRAADARGDYARIVRAALNRRREQTGGGAP